MTTDTEKLLQSLELVPKDNFTKYGGGWEGRISVALIDAVFSMGARYETANGKGVGPRVVALSNGWMDNETDPSNNLVRLLELGEEPIRAEMGEGKVVPGHNDERFKSIAVLEAAQNFVDLGIVSAEDLEAFRTSSEDNGKKLMSAYTGPVGLGKVTFEYFLMLLGVPGVKADRMINRFVERSLGTDKGAREQIIAAHEEWLKQDGNTASLIEFEHAIWRYESERIHPNTEE